MYVFNHRIHKQTFRQINIYSQVPFKYRINPLNIYLESFKIDFSFSVKSFRIVCTECVYEIEIDDHKSNQLAVVRSSTCTPRIFVSQWSLLPHVRTKLPYVVPEHKKIQLAHWTRAYNDIRMTWIQLSSRLGRYVQFQWMIQPGNSIDSIRIVNAKGRAEGRLSGCTVQWEGVGLGKIFSHVKLFVVLFPFWGGKTLFLKVYIIYDVRAFTPVLLYIIRRR